MKIRIILFLFLTSYCITLAQKPEDVYRKPLKEVISEIESRYKIKLQYDNDLITGIEVTYPSWRYRLDPEQTLENIFMPLDMTINKRSDGVYQIRKFNYYERPVEESKKHLDQLLASYPARASWETRKAELRKCFLEQLQLSPLPKKTPLNPIYTEKRKYNGYTVENVGLEVLPGVYLSGSLYRPAKGKGPFAAVLCPHGHFPSDNPDEYGRYRPDQQYRCATLARMGAVVFSYEMFAWGESRLQVKGEDHNTPFALTMQTFNSIRVLDYLTSLPYVDPKRIGVTAASGGGTQSFLITAIDDRITVSVPVVMVSAAFYGGCTCESGLPIHSCSDMATNNAEIAAMASPRPMLVVSEDSDWTRTVPEIEYPYLRKVYSLYGQSENVENFHIENEEHNYGLTKRLPVYDFLARHLMLNIKAVKDKSGKVDESKVTIEKSSDMLVFGEKGKLPENAVKGSDSIKKVMESMQ